MAYQVQKKNISRVVASVALSSAMATSAFAAPQVNPDSYSVTSGQSITFNPVENDSGNGIFIDKLDSPPWQNGSSGTNSFSGNQITYTAPAGFTGTTTFYYGIKDSNGDISSAPVTVTVSAANNGGGNGGGGGNAGGGWPFAGEDAAETQAGQTIYINPLWNDTQGVYVKEANAWSKKGGQIRVEGNALVYTPGENTTGKDTFWYVIADSRGRTNAAKVTVAVSSGGGGGSASAYPVANADYFTVRKGSFNNVLRVFDNDRGEGLYFTGGNGLYAWSEKGGQTFRGSWDVVYNAPDSAGTDTFWYTFEDSIGRTNAAKVTVNVTN